MGRHYSKRQFGKRVSEEQLILVAFSSIFGSYDCYVSNGHRRKLSSADYSVRRHDKPSQSFSTN